LRAHEEKTGRSLLTRERELAYSPQLLALGTVRMIDRKRGVEHQEKVARLRRIVEGAVSLDWQEGEATVGEDELLSKPMGEGLYEPVPSALVRSRDLKRLAKDFSDHLYYNTSVNILYNPALELYSAVGESRRDFRVRCEKEVQERLEDELKKARASMREEIDGVKRKIRREERELKQDEADLAARKREEALGLGESALNLLSGRRPSHAISYASRRRTMTQKAKADVDESLEVLEDLEEDLEDLGAEWEERSAEINRRWADKLEEIEEFEVNPRRTDVTVEFCGLAWVPTWQVILENGRQLELPARE
jgi:hypothetical protein